MKYCFDKEELRGLLSGGFRESAFPKGMVSQNSSEIISSCSFL